MHRKNSTQKEKRAARRFPIIKNLPELSEDLKHKTYVDANPKEIKDPYMKPFGKSPKAKGKTPVGSPQRTKTPQRSKSPESPQRTKTPESPQRTKTPQKPKTPQSKTPKRILIKMTVVQLKAELKKQGKPVSGKKADLIKRLQSDNEPSQQPSPPQKSKTDYSKMTVVQLKAELKKQGKPVSGKKADLIKRLQRDTPSSKSPEKKESPKKEQGKTSKSDRTAYQKMTVVQLRAELKKQGKPVSGKKADLIKRLLK